MQGTACRSPIDIKALLDAPDSRREIINNGPARRHLPEFGRFHVNLVGNAFRATVEKRRSTEESSDGAKRKPSLTPVTRRCERCIEIRIKGNGSGVPPDLIDRVPEWALLSQAMSSVSKGVGSKVETEPGTFAEVIVMRSAAPPSETGDNEITDTPDNSREHIT